MKKFIVVSLAVIGGLAILMFMFVALMALLAIGAKPRVPSEVVLELRLDEGLPEVSSASPFTALEGRQTTLRDVVDALERAGDDTRVKGLVAYVTESPGSMAAAQEIRDAVKAFRDKGKKTVAYADSFGEFIGGNAPYYIASAFEEIYVQPSGDVGLVGLAAESPFIRGALDKLDVKPQFGQRAEYKNAVNIFTEHAYNEPHREATEKFLGSLFDQMVKGVAADRGLEEAEVRALIDGAPLMGEEAVAAKLVTGLAYRDEVYAKVKDGWGKGAELLYLHKYLERAGRPHTTGETIALVYGVGAVARGEGGVDPLAGQAMGGDSVAAALRAAADDDDVKAILFRVDSPGGSYIASDTIRREVQRAREKGKPVVVSMGNLAASGGYFISMDADRIVAQPGTLTGSIGVYAGKFVTEGLWQRLGINFDTVSFGKNATLFSSDQEFTPEHLAELNAALDRIYEDFTAKAAAGRKLPLDKLKDVARGRVWTGADAKELGLVDELGGFATALRAAKELGKIPADAKVRIQEFPRPKSPVEAVLAAFTDQDDADNSDEEGTSSAATTFEPWLRRARAVGAAAERLGLTPNAGVLTAPIPTISR